MKLKCIRFKALVESRKIEKGKKESNGRKVRKTTKIVIVMFLCLIMCAPQGTVHAAEMVDVGGGMVPLVEKVATKPASKIRI